MRDNWKLWLAGAIVVLGLGYSIQRIRTSFGDQPPAWMHTQEFSSPKLSDDLSGQLLGFYHEMEKEAQANGVPIKSLQLVQIEPDAKEVLIWHLDEFTNPGPGPLTRFEVTRWLTDGQLLGYYLLDGTPLSFTLRNHPSNPKTRFAAVLFEKPVAAGITMPVFYLEHQASNLHTNAAGEFNYQFARLRTNDNAIHAVGVILPTHYAFTRYAPTTGALAAMKGMPFVGWINTRLEAVSLPPSATFKPQ